MKCLEYALNYLSKYPKTEKEMELQLLSKGYWSDDIQKAMTILKDKTYINDQQFVEMYLQSECIRKGKPIIVVVKKLLEKRVDKTIITTEIKKVEEEVQDGIYQKIKSEIAAYKKKDLEWFDIIQKILKKGYKLDDIKKVINGR